MTLNPELLRREMEGRTRDRAARYGESMTLYVNAVGHYHIGITVLGAPSAEYRGIYTAPAGKNIERSK